MKIPKGAHIDIPVYGLTRDPGYWDESLIFKPLRYEVNLNKFQTGNDFQDIWLGYAD